MEEAYTKLGVEQVEKLGYAKYKVKRDLLAMNKLLSNDKKIIELLKSAGIKVGNKILVSELKVSIQNIYQEIRFKVDKRNIKTAKASDIVRWFKVEECFIYNDGKGSRAYKITGEKVIYNVSVQADNKE